MTLGEILLTLRKAEIKLTCWDKAAGRVKYSAYIAPQEYGKRISNFLDIIEFSEFMELEPAVRLGKKFYPEINMDLVNYVFVKGYRLHFDIVFK